MGDLTTGAEVTLHVTGHVASRYRDTLLLAVTLADGREEIIAVDLTTPAVSVSAGCVGTSRPLVAAALRDMADRIDRGPGIPMPPSVYSALCRERAAELEAEGAEA